ncbi:hypothetical protein AAOE16_18080 [Ekhidna sp. MALMAid0563]|uniref:conjugative transposon protein TraM n=1 Tax=Ekhidna sp. MALMAid0563 TaxID=3143937 RepID=UPI0032DE34A3
MINKRGKIIALGGGAFFLLLVLMQSMNGGSSESDSFYNNFDTADKTLSISKDQKKKASLKGDEENLKDKAESYQVVRNQKEKGFSLYREIISDEEHEVDETVKGEEAEEQQVPEEVVPVEKTPQPKVVYVERKPDPVQQEQTKEPETRRRRRAAGTAISTGSTPSNNTGVTKVKAEIMETITLDLEYLSTVKIRVLEEITLPSGKKLKKNTLLQGVPSDGNNVMYITIPQYNIEVYQSHDVRGILLTDSEGLDKEVQELSRNEARTTVTVPVLGSVDLASGKKRSRKVTLYQNQSILLRWIND